MDDRDHEEFRQLYGLLKEFFIYCVDIDSKPPIWKYYKTKTFKKAISMLDDITDITKKYVDETIERIEEDRRNGVPEKPESGQSVLEKLIKIDKKIATVMAMDMLLGGVDTVRKIVIYLAYESILLI